MSGDDSARQGQVLQQRTEALPTAAWESVSQLARDLAYSSADVNAVAQTVCSWAQRLLGADYADLMVIDPGGTALIGVANTVDTDAFRQERIDIGAGAVPAALAWQQRRTVVVKNLPSTPVVSEPVRRRSPHLQEAWSVPLVSGGRVIGVLSVGYCTQGGDQPERTRLLGLLGDTAALAVGRAQLAEGLQTLNVDFEQQVGKRVGLIRLLQEVTVAANEATSVEEALRFALDRVCAHTGWPIGHVYVPLGDAAGTLVSSLLWHLDDPERFATFRQVTEATRLTVGVGLPGRVLASGRPVWVVDVTHDSNFPRAKQAENIGVRAGFAFPVMVGKEVVAVLEFFSPQPITPDEPLLELMGNIGTQLGRVFERERAEQKLRMGERLAVLGVTAARVVHEIANPLNGMYTTVQLLERRFAKSQEGESNFLTVTVRDLKHEITRLRSLLQELRVFATLSRLQVAPLDVAQVVAEVLAIEARLCVAQGIRIERNLPTGLPLVMADREKLVQALLHLCRNALEAMPHGGTLTLRGFSSGMRVCLQVSDTGMGIPLGLKVFEPFTTTKAVGTGLGLTIVQQVVVAHGGTVTYASEPGQGTTFTLELPVWTGGEKG